MLYRSKSKSGDFECFWYYWCFKNPVNSPVEIGRTYSIIYKVLYIQKVVDMVVSPIIYKVLAPSQVVMVGFLNHQCYLSKALGRWDSCRDAGLISEAAGVEPKMVGFPNKPMEFSY